MNLNRRQFVSFAGTLGVAAATAENYFDAQEQRALAPAAATGRVVIIGGGMAGVAAAKYLRMWGGTGLRITLVEPRAAYLSNILSSMVLTGQRTLASLQYAYTTLASSYAVTVVKASATAVNTSSRVVTLSTGATLAYDRLVMSPGIRYDAIPGLAVADYNTLFPHAWQAGVQTTLLRNQLVSMAAGGTYLITIPLAPYRCPAGPYERASLIASWLKTNKPGSKVVVLDANPKIMAEPNAFTQAFTSTYAGMLTYVPNATIDHIDKATKTVYTSAGNFKASVLNPIPPHRASAIAAKTGLVNVSGRWAGVDVLSYESTAVPKVHVLGDAIGTTMPKSGHMANAQGKVVGDAVAKLLQGLTVDQAPATSAACFSTISMTTASWFTAVFQYDPATRTMVAKSSAEAPSTSTSNFSTMNRWFTGLMSDTFK